MVGTSLRHVLLRSLLTVTGAQSSTRDGIVGLRIATTTAKRTANQAQTGSHSTICVLFLKAWMNA